MKKYRNITAALLILLVAAAPLPVSAEEAAEPEGIVEWEEEETQEEVLPPLAEEEKIQHLTVASATHPFGMFFTDLWARNTTDLDIQSLLHGYNLIRWSGEEGLFGVDSSVVSGVTVMENANGDRGFRLTLYDDLYYSDGTPITAWDYAFSWLLLGSDEIGTLGITPEDLSWIAGFDEYKDGTFPYLQGVQVISDDTLMVVVDHESMPFFYELGLLSCHPYPIHVIAPGVKVFDDGNGVYLANDPDWEEEEEENTEETEEPEEDDQEEPRFTPELLAQTILDPETGYLSHPSVVSGPYTLRSWDGETAEFEKNTYYKGNLQGRLPLIDRLTYFTLENGVMIEKLEKEEGKDEKTPEDIAAEDDASGAEDVEDYNVSYEIAGTVEDGEEDGLWDTDDGLDLLNKVTDADTITAGMEKLSDPDSERRISMSNYARTGLAYITFARNRETVASKAVRQAIAWCMDRDEIMSRYTGNFGLRVDGYYGIGQWMYRLANGNTPPPVQEPEDENDAQAMAEYEAELAAWEDINLDNLTQYTLDLDTVRRILDADGWRRNTDGIREKDGIVLDLTLAYPEGNRIQEAWEEELIPNLEEVGIRLTLLPMTMEELLDAYYHQVGLGLDAPADDLVDETVLEELPQYLQESAGKPETPAEDDTPETTEKTRIKPDMFYMGSNFSTLFQPELLFEQYAPVENTAPGLAPDTEDRADVISLELEEELVETEDHLQDHLDAYVEDYVESLEHPDREEDAALGLMEEPETEDTDIIQTERTIQELTEQAMDAILTSRISSNEGDDADLSLADVSSAAEKEPFTKEEAARAYQDIYHYYLELYRDYGRLYALAMDMRRTEPGEVLEYMQRWVLFQEQFNEVLPMIPIYSNVYFDFYTSELQNYNISENITWGNAILGAYLAEEETEPETETTTETEEEEDGLVEFED